MRKDRFIAGILCVASAVWTYLAGGGNSTVAPASAIGILGLIMIAISRKK